MTPAFRRMSLAILPLALAACGSGAGRQETHDPAEAAAGAEPPSVAVTSWTERSELFMEHPPLVAGKSGRFAIHVTRLSDFAPLTAGTAVVVLQAPDGTPSEFRGGLSRPGIFGTDVTPGAAGAYRMSLRVESTELQDVHELGSVTVHAPGAPVAAEQEEEGEAISFLKEQQWALEFGTEPVTARALQPSIVVPATVRPQAGGEVLLSAPVPGRIDPALEVPVPGRRVRAGSVLARIAPRSQDTREAAALRADLIAAEQEHALATQEQERARRLVESRAIPSRRLSEADAAATAAKARLDAARQRMTQLGAASQPRDDGAHEAWFEVRAPFAGVVAEARFASGASVEEGEPLLRLVDTDRVHVVGLVPESQARALTTVGAAELLREGEQPLPLGRSLSIGEVVDPAARTVEVRYALDNREARIPVGTGGRLRLFLGAAETLPAVPESAIVDDGGRPVVFVQTGGESFERRAVRLGSREGGFVHVLEGVEPGERVVSRGAYLVRLAAMSTQIPAHGHVH